MLSTVLVTSTGGPAATSLIQALQSEPVRLLACDADPSAPGLRSVAPERRFLVHRSDNPEFIGDLLALCIRCDVDLLVPTGDAELLPIACARDVFERMGTRVLLAPASKLSAGSQRRRVLAACQREHGPMQLPASAARLLDRMRTLWTRSCTHDHPAAS